jgi:predicted transcriptional regulator
MDATEPSTFPDAGEIAKLAKDGGLTIPQLCARAEIAPSTFYRWLRGSEMTVSNARRLWQEARKAAETVAP